MLKKRFLTLLLFFIFSVFTTIPYANATTKSKENSNTLITFLITPDDSQIYSLHSNYSGSADARILMLNDIATGNLIQKISLPLITDFSWFKPSLVITPDGKKLYITDIDKLVYIVDLKTQQVTQLKNKPKEDIDHKIASPMIVTPDGKRIYIADGVKQNQSPAMLHTIDTRTNEIITTVKSRNNGWTGGAMTLNRDASLLYISRQLEYRRGEISVFDTRTNQLEDSAITINGHLGDIHISPTNGLLYVNQRRHVSVIDPVSKQEIEVIRAANEVAAMTFALNGSKLFLADLNDGVSAIRVFDVITKQSYSIPLFFIKRSEMYTSADGMRVYVSNNLENTISVIDANKGVVIQEVKL